MTISQSTIEKKTWTWRGHQIAYATCGEHGSAIVCVHGFGASSGHWRKNLAVWGESHRCYALDLIGFGGSAKPKPQTEINYTFETWGEQIADFCEEVVGTPVFLVGNSIGCVAVMQAAVARSRICRGVININISLRLLHERKRQTLPWYRRLGAPIAQKLLSYPPLGRFFFNQLAKPKTVRNVLLQAYKRQEAVTDELIEILLTPARDEGAADVFVAFTSYSQGPLPEDLLPQLTCPALILWGTDDPWEPIEQGKQFANYPTVEQFIPLPGLGHCPQDEAPEEVNPIVQQWIEEKTLSSGC
ncbi:alpha/beta fold hydrolase [Dactylococcopsis salina]|uniref:Hydrolase or acyltransferase of alpha/beta superfamily n=1 Tax=Dactylococcopsis salina (strain PCC 8305) TaxID=13035 RepID=K9YPK0_DACS8|nr:alpha/beta fold hydrolase [Dactylococcopsis salina]AFZ48866.1 putative hydrolase or acyltransferase of alpha/beta superfamily [Dactylococcopsis salina PCC 8305]